MADFVAENNLLEAFDIFEESINCYSWFTLGYNYKILKVQQKLARLYVDYAVKDNSNHNLSYLLLASRLFKKIGYNRLTLNTIKEQKKTEHYSLLKNYLSSIICMPAGDYNGARNTYKKYITNNYKFKGSYSFCNDAIKAFEENNVDLLRNAYKYIDCEIKLEQFQKLLLNNYLLKPLENRSIDKNYTREFKDNHVDGTINIKNKI